MKLRHSQSFVIRLDSQIQFFVIKAPGFMQFLPQESLPLMMIDGIMIIFRVFIRVPLTLSRFHLIVYVFTDKLERKKIGILATPICQTSTNRLCRLVTRHIVAPETAESAQRLPADIGQLFLNRRIPQKFLFIRTQHPFFTLRDTVCEILSGVDQRN